MGPAYNLRGPRPWSILLTFEKLTQLYCPQFCASGAMFLLANFSGPKAAGKLNKLPRSVHYWADLATFSRFHWHARWVPLPYLAVRKVNTLDGPGARPRAGAIFYSGSRRVSLSRSHSRVFEERPDIGAQHWVCRAK